MCNPRRIRVTATRMLDEAWQREVARVIELQERVVGEARVRQALGLTLGEPTLRALETYLASEESGWSEVPEGYRFNVEGGYITYLVDEQAIEIVAVLEDVVQATGEARSTIGGQVREEIAAEGASIYYDDNYGGRTEEHAQRDAQAEAERRLAEAARERLRQAADDAEAATDAALTAEAHQQAQERLRRQAEERQARLAERARQLLDSVGLRGRQAFHLVVARAYRDALLAYARQRGAENIHITEGEDVVEIEFSFSG